MKLDKLKKRYGITGGTYQDLITKILQENSKVIQKHVIAINDDHYTKVASRFNKKTTKRFVVPDVFDKIPDSGLQLRKSAEKGQLISDTLKDDLRENLREILDLKTGVTGQAKIITQTGKKAGTINNHLIDLYEKKITETFANYIKDDPNAKMPSNIKTIATTEVRSAIHDVQHEYVTELTRRNPSLQIYKKWIHNPNLSILKPRDNHAKLGRLKAIPLQQNYIFQTEKGQTVSASRPHDPSLPPEEVIGCHCDIEYQGVYIMTDDKLQQVKKSLQNMVEKTYEIGKIVDRKDGKWKKTGEGKGGWEKVKDNQTDTKPEDDDKELDAMVDDKKAMQGEMEKETVDQQAEAIAQLIDEGTLTQEEFNNMSPEEIDQLLNDEGFVNEGDPEADMKSMKQELIDGGFIDQDEANSLPDDEISLIYEEFKNQDEDVEEYGGDKLSPKDQEDFDIEDDIESNENQQEDYGNDARIFEDDTDELIRKNEDQIREDLIDDLVQKQGLSIDEAMAYVYDLDYKSLHEEIGDEGLKKYLKSDDEEGDKSEKMSRDELTSKVKDYSGLDDDTLSKMDDADLQELHDDLKANDDYYDQPDGGGYDQGKDQPDPYDDPMNMEDNNWEEEDYEHGLTEDESLESLQAEGFSDEEISDSGMSAQQMLHEYYTDSDIYNDTAKVQLKEEGFTDKQIKDSGLSPKELLTEYQKDMNPKSGKEEEKPADFGREFDASKKSDLNKLYDKVRNAGGGHEHAMEYIYDEMEKAGLSDKQFEKLGMMMEDKEDKWKPKK